MDPNIMAIACFALMICGFGGFVLLGGFGAFELLVASAIAMMVVGGLVGAAMAS
jgi:hypothetical protein